MKKVALLTGGIVVAIACILEMSLPFRNGFDPGDLNQLVYNYDAVNQSTIVLYGNNEANVILDDVKHTAKPGAIFKLVTTKEEQNALGLDLMRNATLENVETVAMISTETGGLKASYSSTKKITSENAKNGYIQERINYITSLKRSIRY